MVLLMTKKDKENHGTVKQLYVESIKRVYS